MLWSSCPVVSDSVTPRTAAIQVSLSLTISQSLPKFMFISLVMPSGHLILWCPLLLPSIFPASGTFPMSHLFSSTTGPSASVSVLPVNIQVWSPIRLTGLISLLFKGLSVVFSRTTVWRHQFFGILHSLWSSFHKTIVSNTLTFVSRIMGMIFNTLSRFVISFLPISNCFMISWL